DRRQHRRAVTSRAAGRADGRASAARERTRASTPGMTMTTEPSRDAATTPDAGARGRVAAAGTTSRASARSDATAAERERQTEREKGSRAAAHRGMVYLVGAGPGDPDLITKAGLNALRRADVVVYDRLAAPDLLREARRESTLIDAGKAAGAHT